ncbi:MAG: septum formation initiator family protein [Desulfuromonadaceae bacterium]|nr:septum formation initiator family protein [Desulfuromonadaceae bacterium]
MLDMVWSPPGIVQARVRVTTVITAILLLLCIGVFHVWLRTEVNRHEYEISQLESQIRKQTYTNKQLQVAVARYSSAEYIEGVATRRLGLQQPDPDQVITVAAQGGKRL